MTTATPTVEFTVKMSEFKRKVRATSYALPADNSLPILGCIRITVENGELMMVGTDRYKIIATRQDLTPGAPVTTGEVRIDNRAAKYLGMMGADAGDELTVKLWDHKVEFSTKDETLSVAHDADSYPEIEKLLVRAFEAPTSDRPAGYNPHYLEDMAKSFKALHPREFLVIQGTKNASNPDVQDPTLLYCPNVDDWVALLMPVRTSMDAEILRKEAQEGFARLLAAQAKQGA